jgi:TrpR-related protein YerC/YecD
VPPHTKEPSAPLLLDDLCTALLALKTREDMRAFLNDLCTPAERAALAGRWHVCRLLDAGSLSYRSIHEHTGVSLATIGRVARFLHDEPWGGYRKVLDALSPDERKTK